MKLADYYTSFSANMTINITAPKAVTILIVKDDKIRIVTNDEYDYKFWKKYLVPDNENLQYHLDTKYPIGSIINAYDPVISYGDPTSADGKKEVTKALNSILPAKHDEILFDYSK